MNVWHKEPVMIRCVRCDNETWTSELVTASGPVMVAGPRGSQPQPISAHVCTACGQPLSAMCRPTASPTCSSAA